MENILIRLTFLTIALFQFQAKAETDREKEITRRLLGLGAVMTEQNLLASAYSDTKLFPAYQKASCEQAITNALARLKTTARTWQTENCAEDSLLAEFGKPKLATSAAEQYTLPPGYQEPSPQCLQQVDPRCVVHCAGGNGPMSGNFSRFEAKVKMTVRCGKSSS